MDRPEQICLRKAIETFNKSFTQDPEKKFILPHPSQACTLHDLVDSVEKEKAKHISGSGTRRWLEILIRAASQHAQAVDVVVQTHPSPAAIIWGGVRLFIGVAVANIEVREKLGDVLVTIVRQIGRFDIEARLYSEFQRVQDALSVLFAHILHFLANAYSHLRRGRLSRFFRLFVGLPLRKLDHSVASFREQSLILDREIRTASETRQTERSQAVDAGYRAAATHRHEFRQSTLENRRLMESIAARQDAMNVDQLHIKMDRTIELVEVEQEVRRELTIQWLQRRLPMFRINASREPGTCEWILEHSAYQTWLHSSQEPFWINGIPGSGKTVLAQYLAEVSPGYVLSYFFRDLESHPSSQATWCIVSLLSKLYQDSQLLGTDRGGVTVKLMALQRYYDSASDVPLEKLLEVLDEFLTLLPKVTVVIDALDECKGRNDFEVFFNYLKHLGSRTSARVVLLSRKDALLDHVFQNAKELQLNESLVSRDILHFAQSEVARDTRLKPLEDEILGRISHDSGGMFLWARLFLASIKQADTLRMRRNRLKECPSGIFDIYMRQLADNDRSLGKEENNLRRQILSLILSSKRPLTVEDVSTILSVDCKANRIDVEDKLDQPLSAIFKYCRPLVMVVGDQVQLIHSTVKQFLWGSDETQDSGAVSKGICYSREDSDTYLALKCLSVLSQAKFRQWKYPAKLLREHLLDGEAFLPSNTCSEEEEDETTEMSSYVYAALHWHEHLTALRRPSAKLLKKLRDFIHGIEFVTWSESLFDLKQKSGLGPQILVRAELKKWYNLLSPEIQEQIPINAFYVSSHEFLNRELVEKADDKILPHLPLSRLGEYFNVGGETRKDWKEAYDYKRRVVNGFKKDLGTRSPVTLRAETALFKEYFWQMRPDEAKDGLAKVARAQREVLGEDSKFPDYFLTLQLLGLALFYVNEFTASRTTLEKSGAGLHKCLGASHIQYLMTVLYNGYASEASGDLDVARKLYDSIWSTWVPIMGTTHPLSLMTQTAIGSIYRKRRCFDSAQDTLLNSWNSRLRLFTIENNICVDSAMQLAVMYRDAGNGEEAVNVLDVVSPSSVFPQDFERECQLRHLRALVAFDSGQYEEPKLDLLRLLHEASGPGPDRENNRELLWVRITLADVLRGHHEDDEALMLFSDIVKRDSDDDDEPEPPSQLRIAEMALRYVRSAKQDKSRELLEDNGLVWVREKDFWIKQGGPITDTAVMAPVRLLPTPASPEDYDTCEAC